MKRTKEDIKKKKSNHGCGKAKCFVCHSEKILDIPSKQEAKADLDYNEQLWELDYSRHPIDKNDPEVWLLELGATRKIIPALLGCYYIEYAFPYNRIKYTIQKLSNGSITKWWEIGGHHTFRDLLKKDVERILYLFIP